MQGTVVAPNESDLSAVPPHVAAVVQAFDLESTIFSPIKTHSNDRNKPERFEDATTDQRAYGAGESRLKHRLVPVRISAVMEHF
jgi:hypothetical protein